MAPKGYYKKSKNQPKPQINIDWSDVLNIPTPDKVKEPEVDPFAHEEQWNEKDLKVDPYDPEKHLREKGGVQWIDPRKLGLDTWEKRRAHEEAEKRRIRAKREMGKGSNFI